MKQVQNYNTAIIKVTQIAVSYILLMVTIVSGCAAKNSIAASLGSSNQTTKEQSGVTIIIYSDFECGACERFNQRIEPTLREYEAAGVLNIEMRLVGAISDDSSRAAQAALWADEKGRFNEFHNTMFETLRQNEDNPYSEKRLLKIAKSLGMDGKSLKRCLEKGCMKAKMEKNMNMFNNDYIHTLPAVIINEKKIEGLKPLETYINAINLALEEKAH